MELNGRKINATTVQIEGSPNWTGGCIRDAYISYAEYVDGDRLTDDDLESLNQLHNAYDWL